jgi:aldehyde dehydrogenase (NAD+)
VHLYTIREPLGVIAVITPWNFPSSTPAAKLGPALVTGSTVVIKPATLTPLSAVRLVEAFAEAGVPRGVVNLVMGSGGKVGTPLMRDKRVRGVSFTGSTLVGQDIAREAAPNFIKTQLELGGKNALVVMEDADLGKAAQAIVDGAFLSCGQKCTATSRVVVHKDIKATLMREVSERTRALRIGNGLKPENQLGPMVDARQLETVLSYIEIGRKDGAKLLFGGEKLTGGDYDKGFFMTPAIFDEVTPAMRIAREEIFGPVLSVLTVGSIDEAIDVANGTDYGLSSAIWTRSLKYAHEFALRMQAGVVKINGTTPGNANNVPFGGRKLSGLGISQKPIDFFTELKSVYQKFD